MLHRVADTVKAAPIRPCAQQLFVSAARARGISGNSRADPEDEWWALKDSNLRPTD
jgi:hypothetical protein